MMHLCEKMCNKIEKKQNKAVLRILLKGKNRSRNLF